MTERGFSAANLERARRGPAAGAPGVGRRGMRVLAAVLILGVLVVQFFLTVRGLPSSFWVAVALLVGFPLTAVIFRRPEIGVLLTIALIPLEAFARRSHDPLSVFKVVGGITFAAFAFGWAFQGRYPRLARPFQNKLVLALGGVLLFSFLFSISREDSLTSLRRFATLFIFYFLVTNLITDRRMLRATVVLVMLTVAISATIAVASYQLGHNLFPGWEGAPAARLRTVGAERNPNNFAATVLVGLPFFFYYFTTARRGAAKLVMAAGAVICILAVIYSFSRGGAIALGAVLAAMLLGELLRLSSRSLLKGAVALAVIGVVLGGLVPRQYYDRLASLGDWKRDDSLSRRSLYVVFGADILLNRPLTGIGPGAFPAAMDTEYRLRFPEQLRQERTEVKRGRAAHNMYMEMAAETGIPGIVAFGLLLLYTLRELRRLVVRFRRDGPADLWVVARATEVAYWGFLVSSVFLSAEYRKYLWLIIGLAVVLRRLAEESAPRAPAVAERPESAVSREGIS